MATNATRNIAYKPSTMWRDILPDEEKVKHKVCTVWPGPITRPHAAFGTHVTIPGRPGKDEVPQPGALSNRYGFALCPPGIERNDLGECRTLALLSISSRRVAMDVIGLAEQGIDETPRADGVRMVIAPAVTTSPLFEKGYFVPAGADPTEAELVAAEARRDAWFKNAIIRGDNAWNQSGGKSDAIHPDSLLAARYLGIQREWAPTWAQAEEREEVKCPVCLVSIVEGVRKCANCNEWLGYRSDGTPYAFNDPAIVKTSAPAAEADMGALEAAIQKRVGPGAKG